MTRRPDLVLIMTDQQRFDQVGYASDGHFETPNLDALAARGVVFDSAYSAATVCVPVRNALLTGLHPHRIPTQENGLALREGFWTIAHALQQAGYETALFGKMHFAPVHARHGFETMRLCEHLSAQGLGPMSVERDDTTDDYHDWLVAEGYDDWRFRDGQAQSNTEGARRYPYPLHTHPTNWIEREVVTFLETRDPNRPLFLVISFPHPHAPYNPPPPYTSMYAPEESALPATGSEANLDLPLVFQLAVKSADERVGDVGPERIRPFVALVRALVKQIDDSLGRILAALDLDSTVVCYTSDHGDYSGNRALLRKLPAIPFDDLARVPFLAAGAGIPGGRRVHEPVQSSDVALTFLDFARVDPPTGVEFESRSLRLLLTGSEEVSDPDRAVFCVTSFGAPMVRRGALKYVRHRERDAAMLFDLAADPQERVDRHEDPEYRVARDELAALLRDELARPVLDLPAAATRTSS